MRNSCPAACLLSNQTLVARWEGGHQDTPCTLSYLHPAPRKAHLLGEVLDDTVL